MLYYQFVIDFIDGSIHRQVSDGSGHVARTLTKSNFDELRLAMINDYYNRKELVK